MRCLFPVPTAFGYERMLWQQDRKLGGTADYIRPMCLVHMGFFAHISRIRRLRITK